MIQPSDNQIRQYAEAVADCLTFPDEATRERFIANLMALVNAASLKTVKNELKERDMHADK